MPAATEENVAVAFPAITGTEVVVPTPLKDPCVLANATVAIPGALMRICKELPICMAVRSLFAIRLPLSLCSSTLKEVVEVGVTVYTCVLISPIAEMFTVAVPGLEPDTVATNWPVESVFPLAGEKLTLPPPIWARATGIPGAVLPPASLTVTVSVAVDVPLSGSEVTGDVTSMVDPVIKTVTCDWTPFALAVIVAVRVAMSVAPDEKSTAPLP